MPQITIRDGLFLYPRDAPGAEEMRLAGWVNKNQNEICTDSAELVIPWINLVRPDILSGKAAVAASYDRSWSVKAPDEFIASLPAPKCGKKLFDYQTASVFYIESLQSSLLADPPGMGKSAIMAAVANLHQARSVLIIVPAIAKENWRRNEWPKWTSSDLSVGAVYGDEWVDTDVVIINYDILHRHYDRLRAKTWDLVLIDEAHRLKNPTSRRTLNVVGGRKGKQTFDPIPYRKRIFATATPMDRPIDLWVIIRACDPDGLGRDKKLFEEKYCQGHHTSYGWDARGASNLRELGAVMRSRFMVRHDEAVLDLPEMTESLFLLPPVELILEEDDQFIQDNMAAIMGMADAMGKPAPETKADYMRIVGEAVVSNIPALGSIDGGVMFTKFSELREKTGLAKIPAVVEYIRNVVESGNPPVIFAYHRSVLKALHEHFPDYGIIIGGMSPTKRQDQIDAFQRGELPGIMSNIDAGGEAVTLTLSNQLIFVETDWRGRALIQARKRIHRIGQTRPSTATHLCAADSFDSFVAEIGLSKIEDQEITID